MSVFAIADLHLSLSADKPMDVFEGWDNYLPKLESNWRSIVKPEDTVVIPGDISWAMSLEGARRDFEFLHGLPGKKLILKGNHDYWWTTMKRMKAFLQANAFSSIDFIHNCAAAAGKMAVCGSRGWFYEENGDKKVLLREVGRIQASILEAQKTGLEPVVFLHYPPVYSSYICEEVMEVLRRHGIRRCYYGHLHGKAAEYAVQGLYDGILFRLVSADYLRFRPMIVG